MKSSKPDFAGEVEFWFEDMWMKEDTNGEIEWSKLFDVNGVLA